MDGHDKRRLSWCGIPKQGLTQLVCMNGMHMSLAAQKARLTLTETEMPSQFPPLKRDIVFSPNLCKCCSTEADQGSLVHSAVRCAQLTVTPMYVLISSSEKPPASAIPVQECSVH